MAVQPIVDLRTGRVEAVEILSRSPGGVLLPDEMFRLARQHGVLEHLTLLSCKKLTEHIHKLTPFVQKGLFFNIEADVNCHTMRRAVEMLNSVAQTPVVFEITEHMPSVFLWKPFLEEQGISLAMDDLGKGNSNMVELLNLKPHYVKICTEIVFDLHKSGVKAIMIEQFKRIGDSLNLQIIAEGIESLEDLKKLREMGIEYGQGYYFSKPSLIEQIPMDEWKAGFQSRF
nr:EAL domain-containing protein [Effusibacillus dendaii]